MSWNRRGAFGEKWDGGMGCILVKYATRTLVSDGPLAVRQLGFPPSL